MNIETIKTTNWWKNTFFITQFQQFNKKYWWLSVILVSFIISLIFLSCANFVYSNDLTSLTFKDLVGLNYSINDGLISFGYYKFQDISFIICSIIGWIFIVNQLIFTFYYLRKDWIILSFTILYLLWSILNCVVIDAFYNIYSATDYSLKHNNLAWINHSYINMKVFGNFSKNNIGYNCWFGLFDLICISWLTSYLFNVNATKKQFLQASFHLDNNLMIVKTVLVTRISMYLALSWITSIYLINHLQFDSFLVNYGFSDFCIVLVIFYFLYGVIVGIFAKVSELEQIKQYYLYQFFQWNWIGCNHLIILLS